MSIKQRKAGVALDAHKLETFKKHLDAAGYKYTEHTKGLGNNLINYLEVIYTDLDHLRRTIKAADEECRALRARMH